MEKIEIAKAAATLAAALIIFLGGFRLYAYQRSIDRTDKLREKKQAAYERYLHALFIAATRADPERNADNDAYQLAKLSVFVLVPDSVVRAAGNHQQLIQVGSKPPKNAKSEAFAALIVAMRADSFESSKLTEDDIVSLSPISHPH